MRREKRSDQNANDPKMVNCDTVTPNSIAIKLRTKIKEIG